MRKILGFLFAPTGSMLKMMAIGTQPHQICLVVVASIFISMVNLNNFWMLFIPALLAYPFPFCFQELPDPSLARFYRAVAFSRTVLSYSFKRVSDKEAFAAYNATYFYPVLPHLVAGMAPSRAKVSLKVLGWLDVYIEPTLEAFFGKTRATTWMPWSPRMNTSQVLFSCGAAGRAKARDLRWSPLAKGDTTFLANYLRSGSVLKAWSAFLIIKPPTAFAAAKQLGAFVRFEWELAICASF